ncbi:SPOR domain-containing protein [Pseudomonas sp. A-R-26]
MQPRVNLGYTSTRRQAVHWHRVRLGPISSFSDAKASISMAST